MEVFVELQGLTAASGACQHLMTMLPFCLTRMFADVIRDTPCKGVGLATARGTTSGWTENQSRSDSSQGYVDSGSAPSAVTRTCCSSLTPSVSPTAPM